MPWISSNLWGIPRTDPREPGDGHAKACLDLCSLDAPVRLGGHGCHSKGRVAEPRDAAHDRFSTGLGDDQKHGDDAGIRGHRTSGRPKLQSRHTENFFRNKKGGGEVKQAIRQWRVLLLLLVLWPPLPGQAQALAKDVLAASQEEEALERWRQMSPQEKQELRNRYQRWKSLAPEEREELRKKFEIWRGMTPDEKKVIRRNFERWRNLPPQQQERLRERWDRWRNLPPERREVLRRRFQKLQQLSPEERRQLREQFRDLRQRLSPEEKRAFRERFREKRQRPQRQRD